VHHSDRGSSYASDDYRRELKRFGIRASMSHQGDCFEQCGGREFLQHVEG